MKIAAYTICLNEMKHIDRWLEATSDADLRVIVDTGSQDGTWERLQQKANDTLQVHQIKVEPFRFDDARNAALALVPQDIDVCVSVDMDEIPQNNFFQTIRDEWKIGTRIGWHRMHTGPVWNGHRIHSRFGIRWYSPCHEIIDVYGDVEKVEQTFDIQIDHRPDDSKSRKQYLQMLEMAVKENPYDGRMWIYLTREYYFNKMWSDILESASAALSIEENWNVEKSYMCRLSVEAAYALNLDPLPFIEEGLKHDPTSVEMHYTAAYHYYTVKDWKKCYEHSSKRLSLKKTDNYLCENSVWDWRMYDLMGMSAWYLGMKDKALKYAQMAVNGNPDDERLVQNLELIKNGM